MSNYAIPPEVRSIPFGPLMYPHIQRYSRGYESYYIKFNTERDTFWIRFDLVKRTSIPPSIKKGDKLDNFRNITGEVWYIRFGDGRPTVYAKQTFEFGTDSSEGRNIRLTDLYIRIGRSKLGMLYTEGEIPERKIKWNLMFDTSGIPGFPFIPAEIPLGKQIGAVCPYPYINLYGIIEESGKVYEISGAPGELGHHWGKKHSKNWFYYHINKFTENESKNISGREDVPIDALLRYPSFYGANNAPLMFVAGAGGKISFIKTNFMYIYTDSLYRIINLTGGSNIDIKIDNNAEKVVARFIGRFTDSSGRKVEAELVITSPFERFIGLKYADPSGDVFCYNTMTADAVFRLAYPSGNRKVYTSEKTAAFEIGTRKKIGGLKILL